MLEAVLTALLMLVILSVSTGAKEKGITQIFIGHSQQLGWLPNLRGNPVDRLIELAEGIDVRVFPQKASQ